MAPDPDHLRQARRGLKKNIADYTKQERELGGPDEKELKAAAACS
jgi:hypothetical protein